MSGADVSARVALFGKLPSHGDFVRRGGPSEVLAMLDGWLDVELSAAARGGRDPDLMVAALDGVRVAVPGSALMALVASEDAVGRIFPVAALTGADADPADAERWCAEVAGVLAGVRDTRGNADAALAAISAVPLPRQGEALASGWWRAGEAPSGDGLPRGEAFRKIVDKAA